MPAIKVYRNPWEEAQALVADHAFTKYGIRDADPLKLVTEIAFAPRRLLNEDGEEVSSYEDLNLRLNAAKTLLKYTRPEVKSIQMDVTGQVDVSHTHRTSEAVEKAKSLIDSLSRQKYLSGKIAHEKVEQEQQATAQDAVLIPRSH